MQLQDFTLVSQDDGTLLLSVIPPTPIGGWTVQTQISKRFGSQSGLIYRYMASGFYGTSGMNIVVSGPQGAQMSISISGGDMSGQDSGNFAVKITRTDVGQQTTLAEGYYILTP